jgi:putative hydrolase of the HAD superfamily
VNAYRETSRAYLQPYHDTIPVILTLRDFGCKVAVLSEGNPVKQWQKLIRLGAQHLFHKVLMSEEIDKEHIDKDTFKALLVDLALTPKETIFVGTMINNNFINANQVGIISAWIRRGITATEIPQSKDSKPHYQLESLNDLIKIIKGENPI